MGIVRPTKGEIEQVCLESGSRKSLQSFEMMLVPAFFYLLPLDTFLSLQFMQYLAWMDASVCFPLMMMPTL